MRTNVSHHFYDSLKMKAKAHDYGLREEFKETFTCITIFDEDKVDGRVELYINNVDHDRLIAACEAFNRVMAGELEAAE